MDNGHGGEAILSDGECMCTVSSIAYGFSVKKLLAFAYLKPQYAAQGTRLGVLVMDQSRAVTVQTEAAYEPGDLRPRPEESDMSEPTLSVTPILPQHDHCAITEAALPDPDLTDCGFAQTVKP